MNDGATSPVVQLTKQIDCLLRALANCHTLLGWDQLLTFLSFGVLGHEIFSAVPFTWCFWLASRPLGVWIFTATSFLFMSIHFLQRGPPNAYQGSEMMAMSTFLRLAIPALIVFRFSSAPCGKSSCHTSLPITSC